MLILLFGPVSGPHFNPVVSAVDWRGRRRGSGLTGADAATYPVAQIVGGCAGAVLANLMFALPAVQLSGHARSVVGPWVREAVATAGLIRVGVCAASRRRSPGDVAVGHARRR